MKTQNTILSAAFVLALMYGVSAILGLVRNRLLAAYFGDSPVLGIFYTADRIPSFVNTLLVVGTLSTVFIPVFTQRYKNDEEDGWRTASSMVSVTLLGYLVLGGLAYLFAEPILNLLAVGQFTAEELSLAGGLMRLMLIAQMFLLLGSFITSVLQSFKLFIVPALAPILYNAGMIIGVLFLTDYYGIYAAAWGVFIGSIFHVLVQLPLLLRLRPGLKLRLSLLDPGVKEILTLTPPRILSTSINHITFTIANSLAILISTSSVVYLKFASQLQSFPVQLFGASIALAALPTLSYESDSEDKKKFVSTFLTSFHQMMFLVIPSSVVLLILRVPVVRLVFGADRFSWDATLLTAKTLGFFALSIFAQSGIYLLSRAFYALKDTMTPVWASLAGLVVNLVLAIPFVYFYNFEVWSVALAFSLGSLVNMLILMAMLDKKVGGIKMTKLYFPTIKIGLAGLLMGMALWGPMRLLDVYVFDTSRTLNLILLTGVVSLVGMVVYLAITWVMRIPEIELFYKVLRKLNLMSAPVPQNSVKEQPSPEL